MPSNFPTQGFTRLPQHFFERLLAAVSPSCVALCGIVLERTIGLPRKAGTPAPEWCAPSEAELGRVLRMTEQGVRKLITEARTCIADDPESPLGIIETRKAGRTVELRFVFENYRRIKPRREAKELPTKAEREERRQVLAKKAELVCPVGMQCPVTEVYLNGHVTNVPPAEGVEIIRLDPENTETPVSVSGPAEQADSRMVSTPAEQPDTETRVSVSAPTNGRQSTESRVADKRLSGKHRNSSCGIAEVRAVVQQVLGYSIDEALANQILAKLGRATAAMFHQVLLRRAAEVESKGFLPHIAEDTATERAAGLAQARGWIQPNEITGRCKLGEADIALVLEMFP
ncbi:MAG TPA: hypothetical protein VHA11_09770, partial [Bryobacteraceae bacterium]|nr:hypothetical protein [Bryobacteraceae bacterium]